MIHEQLNGLCGLLLEQLPEGIILTDADGQIVFANRAAEQIRNVRREDLIGRSVLLCHKEETRPRILRAIANLKGDNAANYHRMVTDQQNQKVYDNNYVSIRGAREEVQGIAIITRDVTMQRKADEAQARFAKEQEAALNKLRQQYHQLMLSSLETLTNLLEAKDAYTNGHSIQVAVIAQKLYEHRYGINNVSLDIQTAAKLHDIGKICIPDHILHKPGKLTEEEYDVVKQHSTIAADIIRNLDPDSEISCIVRHHHERYDGMGYPAGLRREEIPLGSRVIAIADSFDAMITDRPYRGKMTFEQCIREIKSNSGRQFDPEWVEIFLELAETGCI